MLGGLYLNRDLVQQFWLHANRTRHTGERIMLLGRLTTKEQHLCDNTKEQNNRQAGTLEKAARERASARDAMACAFYYIAVSKHHSSIVPDCRATIEVPRQLVHCRRARAARITAAVKRGVHPVGRCGMASARFLMYQQSSRIKYVS